MIKRPFFGLARPKVEYDLPGSLSVPAAVPSPSEMTFLADVPCEKTDRLTIKNGDTVKGGQKLGPIKDSREYVVPALDGTITAITSHIGNFGRKYTAITVAVDGAGAETETAFAGKGQTPSLEAIRKNLRFIPGGLPQTLLAENREVETIVVCGADEDLLCMTRQSVLKNEMDALRQGVNILQKLFGGKTVVLTAPESMVSAARAAGIEVKNIGRNYPAANPFLVARNCLNRTIPAGNACEDEGLHFISAEAAASLGKAYAGGILPNRKIITVLGPNNEKKLVTAVLGTPTKDVLTTCGITVNQGDRIVFGGPMTGRAVYSEDYPVRPDTDMILVQEAGQIPPVADRTCINCGECVRMCPANLPVNVLIRYLDAGEYSDAADKCDLLSCIECGLCSLVCPAQIPIFQYITLGKYEFARLSAMEADNA